MIEGTFDFIWQLNLVRSRQNLIYHKNISVKLEDAKIYNVRVCSAT